MPVKNLVVVIFFLSNLSASFAQSEIMNESDTKPFILVDKCAYKSGELIHFTLARGFRNNLRARYKYLNNQVADVRLTTPAWTWKAPVNDFKGYMVEVYSPGKSKEQIIATIAVDVSSNWKKFPRYGFVSQYQPI